PASLIDPYFLEGYIERVEVSRSNKEWKITIRKDMLVPAQAYRTFCLRIKEKMEHIAAISFEFRYGGEVSAKDIVGEYWKLFLEWVQRQVPSVNGWMVRAGFEVENDLVTVTLGDSTALELARKKNIDRAIVTFYETYFALQLRVKLQTGETSAEAFEEFQQRIVEEEREVIQKMMESMTVEAPPEEVDGEVVKLQIGYDIKEPPVPIQDIQDEEKKITIQGTIFGLDRKELRNGNTLFTFNLTDFTDSLAMKLFAKTKEDLKVMGQLANGKWVKARGKVEFDRFMQVPELVMIPSDLTEITAPPGRKDNAPEKRVEFHLHTTMSTMDAVTPIGDYVKMAAKWGHKAIAITDHGGVQSYPDAAKAAKKNGIKMIYGVEANVVNDDVAVVLNPRGDDLKDATYIVFDIETTGLSVTQNKIIELAAVKMQDGKEVDRYATFVNPHERIPYNIQQLTNINDEMVRDAPDVEPVLRRFVEFAGDAVLVAHNARFDVDFVNAKLKELGLPQMNNPVLDTLELARMLFPTLKNHRLNTLAAKYKVSLENHHRAIDDTLALGEILNGLLEDAIKIE
ncbi:MAG: exonuclease domain-containing protein, partial [Paenibacillus macerans]|nr:exonuclease domain-containing protein [Paenibacillus macerans]